MHTSLATIFPNSEVRNVDTFGILKLTLHPTSYDWQFVPEAGKSFTDSGTDVCHGSNPPITTSTVAPTPTKASMPMITPTPTPASADIQIWVDSPLQASPSISRGQSQPMSYAGVNNGAAQILSTNL